MPGGQAPEEETGREGGQSGGVGDQVGERHRRRADGPSAVQEGGGRFTSGQRAGVDQPGQEQAGERFVGRADLVAQLLAGQRRGRGGAAAQCGGRCATGRRRRPGHRTRRRCPRALGRPGGTSACGTTELRIGSSASGGPGSPGHGGSGRVVMTRVPVRTEPGTWPGPRQVATWDIPADQHLVGCALGHRADRRHRSVGLLCRGEGLPGAFVQGGAGQTGIDHEEFAEQVPALEVQPVVDPGGQPGGEVVGDVRRQTVRVLAPVGEVEDGVGDVVGDVALDGPGFRGAGQPGRAHEVGLGRAGREAVAALERAEVVGRGVRAVGCRRGRG